MCATTVDLLLVVGNSRSGTSVLARSLGLHEELVDLGETHFVEELLPAADPNEPIAGADATRFSKSLQDRLAHGLFGQREGDVRVGFPIPTGSSHPVDLLLDVAEFQTEERPSAFIEQTPGHLYHGGALLEGSTRTSVVVIVRDPRAVVFSNCNRWRAAIRWARTPRAALEVVRSWGQGHPLLQALLWRRGIRRSLELEAAFPERVIRISYEDLVSEPESTLRLVSSSLGLPFQEVMLAVDVQGSSSSRNEPSAEGFQERSSTPPQLRLNDGGHRLVEQICRSEMAALGYATTGRGNALSAIVQCLTVPKVAIGVLVSFSRLGSLVAVVGKLFAEKATSPTAEINSNA